MPTNSHPEPTAAGPASLRSKRGVIVVVDTSASDDAYIDAAKWAVGLALQESVPLTVYDRSEETWGDSQHPSGPLGIDDDRLVSREALSRFMAQLSDDALQLQAWVSTLPTISAVTSALSAVNADVVVLATAAERGILERALIGDSNAESLALQITRNPTLNAVVVEVEDDVANVINPG